MKRSHVILIAILFLAVPGARACALSISGARPAATLAYNPFDAAETSARVSLQIANAGNKACDGALAFFHTGPLLAKSGGARAISYDIKNQATGLSLAGSESTPPMRIKNPFLAATAVKPGETRQVAFAISLPSGQLVPPGDYTDTIAIATYQGIGSALALTTASMPLNVTVSVDAVGSVNIAGGGQATTVDFGTLANGGTRAVTIQARSNTGFRFALLSEHGGVMALDPPASDGIPWRVPYTMRINNGAGLTLTTPRTVSVTSGQTPLGGTNIPVEIRIGDPSGQRAGIYKDVVSIRIETPQ